MSSSTILNLCSDSCLVFIITGVICAIVRWFHICRQYEDECDYYYPARQQITTYYAALIVFFPYVLAPENADIWLFARVFGVIFYPMCFASLFMRYFQQRKVNSGWNNIALVYLPIVLLAIIFFMAVFGNGTTMSKYEFPILVSAGTIGCLMLIKFVSVGLWLKRMIEKYNTDNFSNENDFPFKFARRVILMPLVWIAIMWIVFIFGSREVKAVSDIVCSFIMVYFLLIILHPQRIMLRNINEETTEIQQSDESEVNNTVNERCLEMRQEVLSIISRRYKEPNLLRTDVISEIDFGKRTLAGAYISKFGFYTLVNTFRLEYARRYSEDNPKATKEQIAAASGFKDRFALNNAKKRIGEIDLSQIKDFIDQ